MIPFYSYNWQLPRFVLWWWWVCWFKCKDLEFPSVVILGVTLFSIKGNNVGITEAEILSLMSTLSTRYPWKQLWETSLKITLGNLNDIGEAFLFKGNFLPFTMLLFVSFLKTELDQMKTWNKYGWWYWVCCNSVKSLMLLTFIFRFSLQNILT